MNIDNILREELKKKKARFQDESRQKEKPLVISNEDIEILVEKKPTTKPEFNKLVDVDYRYQNEFIDLIKSIVANSENLVELSEANKNTIRELEKKLIEINKRNRMLYLPKLPVASLDLNDTLFDPFDILFRRKTLKVNASDNPIEYKLLNSVYRDSSKTYRDKGVMDLFIGYPFIKGKIADDFYIHAPLALFPVTLEKNLDSFKLKLDTSREVSYNLHLVLANYKFHEVYKSLPNGIIEELNLPNFLNDLIDFYDNEGFRFFAVHKEMAPFIPTKVEDLKYYRIGDFSLESYCVLARFSSYSTILQRDFEQILTSNIINTNLAKLLSSETANFKTNEKAPKELDYVGELNSSQEDVIRRIIERDGVVVEGPPGTGKSQTITSLVTNFVYNDKTVLLVSEKKAALDVVKSRLGILNKFALQIDDSNDKEGFYDTLAKMFDDNTLKLNSNQEELDRIDNEINQIINRFKKIDEVFYQENSFKVSPAKLYLETNSFNLDKPGEKILYDAINSSLEGFDFTSLTYDTINDSYIKFSDTTLLNKALLYSKYKDTYISYLLDNISDYELLDVRINIKQVNNIYESTKKSFIKLKLKREVKRFIKRYFKKSNRKIKKDIIKNGLEISYLDDYQEFQVASKIYHSLTEENKYYFKGLEQVLKNVEHIENKANDKLRDYIIYNYISNYEQVNEATLNDLYNYNVLYNNLDNLYKKKKELVLNIVYNKLLAGINKIKSSEKWDEINHNIIGAKRKYNISRFLNRYYGLFDEGIKIWLMTPEVVSEVFPLLQKSFDLIIFDEASQLYIEKSIPAIFRAKKILVAGDSKQLKPSSLGSGRLEYDVDEYDEDNIALEEESLLELAKYKILPPQVLNFHYRSKYQELISFSNYAFYDDDLYISPNNTDRSYDAIKVIKIDNGRWINRANKAEALKVVELIKEIITTRDHNQTIGVITFNSQQRDLILDTIEEKSAKDGVFANLINEEFARTNNGEDIGLFVKNIENVQGDERDIIIFSIGYARNEENKLVHNFGWLNQKGGENRLNVAITRAKEKVYVITSINPNELKVDQSLNPGPRYLKKYLEYCFAVSNNDKALAKSCLYSLREANILKETKEEALRAEVYQEIRRRGFNVVADVGIGKYSISLAVKQDDKYLLGIEFDINLYKNISSERERDYSRRKYLEGRGWQIYRIWVVNWYHDKDKEIDNICKTLANICKDNIYLIEE